jgi:PncC family amidohydrolase
MFAMENAIPEVVREVHELFSERKLTVSAAESCTGGLVCHYLTYMPGSSLFFRAGIVAYSNESKKEMLGIRDDILGTYGAVSEECAMEMAERARLVFNTDYSVATTGNLGPDAFEGKEKGLVYIAVGKANETFTKRLKLAGGREENKERTALEALRFLAEMIRAEAVFG